MPNPFERGPRPTEHPTCPVCKGAKTVKDANGKPKMCGACNGTGRIR